MPSKTNNETLSPPSSPTGAPSKEELLQGLAENLIALDRDQFSTPETFWAINGLTEAVRFLVEENAQLREDIKELQRQSGGWS